VTVRGVGWYGAAFIALIVSVAFIAVAAASFFASLTPLYVSIVCSVAAVAFGVVAAVRARPGDGVGSGDAPQPNEPRQPEAPADAAPPAADAEPADTTQPGDPE